MWEQNERNIPIQGEGASWPLGPSFGNLEEELMCFFFQQDSGGLLAILPLQSSRRIFGTLQSLPSLHEKKGGVVDGRVAAAAAALQRIQWRGQRVAQSYCCCKLAMTESPRSNELVGERQKKRIPHFQNKRVATQKLKFSRGAANERRKQMMRMRNAMKRVEKRILRAQGASGSRQRLFGKGNEYQRVRLSTPLAVVAAS